MVNPDGTIGTINQTTLDLLGYQENELIGKSINIVFGEEEALLSEGSGLDDDSTEKGIVRNREKTYLSKDGRRIPMLFSSSAMRDDGKVQGIICVARDITERKKAEEALKNSAREWHATFDAVGDSVFLTDLEGRILRCNRAMAKFLRKSFSEIIGRTCWRLLHSTLEPTEDCPLRRMRKSSRREKGVLSIGERYFETTVDPFRDKDGALIGAAHIMTDITERKKAEKKIKAHQKKLRALASELTLTEEREKRHLATELHDSISQLLALCRIKLGELEKVTRVSDSRSLIEEIEKRLEEIIWHTRSLTLRLGPPVLYELGLEAALQWLADYMQEQYGIQTKFKVDEEAEPVDEKLRVFLFRTVQELMMNVAKHAEIDKAKVSVWKENDRIHITVEDRGVGFNTADLETSLGKDTGFGLFSIRERIKYFRGELSIQSKPGEGTQVTFMVPLK